MGNGLGLWRVNSSDDGLTHMAPDLIRSTVNSLLPGVGNTLFIGTDTGLFIYQNSTFQHYLLNPNILSSANAIHGMVTQNNDCLWLATNDGLYSFHLITHQIVHYPYAIDHKVCAYNTITLIGHNLYLGTMGQGIICFNTQTHCFTAYLSVDCNVISQLSRSEERRVGK